jgi:hypothetical protein
MLESIWIKVSLVIRSVTYVNIDVLYDNSVVENLSIRAESRAKYKLYPMQRMQMKINLVRQF